MYRNLEWVSLSNPGRSKYHCKLDVHLQVVRAPSKKATVTLKLSCGILYPHDTKELERLVRMVGSLEMLIADLT